ncbi:type II toxin-antitoxin system VapB family antitoxin [Dyadobacter sp. OTU695]|uniref:type II toxin-antitoxin system VapB family antitoxin n=1 Tax=Dyadobacter sp. OTU695 TaxID=3043860 RepID=UPI00313C33B7
MNDVELLKKVSELPDNLKEEIGNYIDFLLQKSAEADSSKKPLKFGMMKDTFIMVSDDFDEPLDDFKEYM